MATKSGKNGASSLKGKQKDGGKKSKGPPSPEGELSERELIELLSPKREMDLKIQRTFDSLPQKYCIILTEKPSDYGMLTPRLVKYFVNKGMKGVYVTVNKNTADLLDAFRAENIRINNILFIDAVAGLTGVGKIEGESFNYVDSPKDIVGLSILIEKAVASIGEGKKFIIVDSVSTLFVYNKERVVERFIHSLSGKIRAWKAKGVFILAEATSEEIVNVLSQFCDRDIIL
jgi:archaellum biogenesis ATPase FlaH